MPQLSYPQNQSEAFAGLIADDGFHRIESMQALEAISFGFGIARSQANPTSACRLAHVNNVVILDDAGTFTAGDIVATVNGTDVTESFDTSKDVTMTALAASIQALATVLTATYSSVAHTITVVAANDVELTITMDVTGITGNMTITSITGTSSDVMRGIAVHSQIRNRTLPVAGSSSFSATGYVQYDAVSVGRQIVVWAEVADAVVENADVYVIITGADKGKLTDDSSSPNVQIATAKFRSATSDAGIAKVEINIP